MTIDNNFHSENEEECEINEFEVNDFQYSQKYPNRNKKRERDIKHKKHLQFLECSSSYPQPVYYMSKAEKPYYKRIYRKSNRYKYYKKIANRTVRRYKGEIKKGGAYKKYFDYWWEVD